MQNRKDIWSFYCWPGAQEKAMLQDQQRTVRYFGLNYSGSMYQFALHNDKYI